MWKLDRIRDVGAGKDENYVFTHADGRIVTVEHWRSIERVYYRKGERTIAKAPQLMIDAVYAAQAYRELMDEIETFPLQDLGI